MAASPTSRARSNTYVNGGRAACAPHLRHEGRLAAKPQELEVRSADVFDREQNITLQQVEVVAMQGAHVDKQRHPGSLCTQRATMRGHGPAPRTWMMVLTLKTMGASSGRVNVGGTGESDKLENSMRVGAPWYGAVQICSTGVNPPGIVGTPYMTTLETSSGIRLGSGSDLSLRTFWKASTRTGTGDFISPAVISFSRLRCRR